jgi:L-2-hydroxyglutarate oxidase LhgO
VEALRWATPGELANAEPDVRAVAALMSPDTGIVDSHGLMESLRHEAERAGALVAFGHEYEGADPRGTGYRIRYRAPDGSVAELAAAYVVNAAGLSADDVAAAMGLDVDALGYRLRFVKGNYFRLSERWRGRLRHLIYPVPHTGLTGLGSHVTLDLSGGARLGPDVEFLDSRDQRYAVSPERAAGFVEAVSRYLPDLRLEDLRPDQAGIRCRRVIPGSGSPDFVIEEERAHGLPGWVNLIGIESPGLTCSIEIARRVESLLAA